ncbi:hypothetical protein [Arthrobacter sp. Z1-15]
MKTRHAALIRKGILAARDPELRQYVHLGSRLFREAARREADNMHWRELRHWLTNAQPNHTRPEHAVVIRHADELVRARVAADIPDTFKAARTDGWDGYSIPHRAVIGIDPAAINAEQAEHIRRFYA